MKFFLRYSKQLSAILLLVLIAVLLPRLLTLTVADILNFVPGSLPLAALIIIGIYCVKTLLMFIPVQILYVASGLLFPPAWAIIITFIALALEMTLGYLIGRRMGEGNLSELFQSRPRLEKIFSKFKDHGGMSCFIARVLPVPVELFSFYYGFSKMPFGRYLLFSLLGMCPAMLPFVLAGNAIENPLSPQFLIPFCISLLVCGGIMSVYYLLSKNTQNH